MSKIIVYQGEEGAYSHLACTQYYPEYEAVACRSFAAAFELVSTGRADMAMIPVENSLAGRVSDIYYLLPEGGLYIRAEHFLPVHHNLLGLRGAKRSDIQLAYSHPMALSQVRNRLADWGIMPRTDLDTAGAAKRLSRSGEKHEAAIASSLAAEIYDLEIIDANIEDADHNTTRFLALSLDASVPEKFDDLMVTSFVFKVRNIPSALYKALGGFATNGLNMTKLESYMEGGSFQATQFYADVEGHPEDPAMGRALDELRYFSQSVHLLGTYMGDVSRHSDEG